MKRRLTAILAADSRMMGADEVATLAALKPVRAEIIDGKISEHTGRIVKLTSDGSLAEFPGIVSALAREVKMQRGISEGSARLPPGRRIEFDSDLDGIRNHPRYQKIIEQIG